MNIIILFPTDTEASLFRREGVQTVISGVGLTATAAMTQKLILEQRPDWLILAGIAGVFPHSQYKIGDVVLVESEIEGDFGFFTPDGFTHMAHLPIEMEFERRHTLHCPHLPSSLPFPLARSLSLNAAMAPFVDTTQADIENMEGAAFFHVCQQAEQKFLELRSISNVAKPDGADWDMQRSVQAMTDGLHRLLDDLLASH